MKKIKVLTIGDHPLSPSGVGTQTRYIVEGLLETKKYSFISFGGAMKHIDYQPIKTEEYQEDWVIYPVDGYGSQDMVRSVVRTERPDVIWIMTDPRFWSWLWEIENELRPLVPIIYYHVWDNYPYPTYNKKFYESNDFIAAISKVTHNVVQNVAPSVENKYIPHSVNTNIFKKLDAPNLQDVRQAIGIPEQKTIFFWNNRNARRKQSGSLLFWFKQFLDEVGHDKSTLLMHTEVKDQHGQDLEAIIHHLGLINGEVVFSEDKVPPDRLAEVYNMVDCTINISDAEGFGLATLESLACETPIIVNMTGGLQEQVTDGENWFGIGLEPVSKAIIGSQEIPWIYEDRINGDDLIKAMKKIHKMSSKKKEELGKMGRKHVLNNYGFENFIKQWDETFTYVHEKFGSWETRKGYKSWAMIKL